MGYLKSNPRTGWASHSRAGETRNGGLVRVRQ